jgi:hypothetical protein
MKKLFILFLLLWPLSHFANNISLANISLAGINTTNQTVQVRFSVG